MNNPYQLCKISPRLSPFTTRFMFLSLKLEKSQENKIMIPKTTKMRTTLKTQSSTGEFFLGSFILSRN